MNASVEKYFGQLVNNAATLVWLPDEFAKEEKHLQEYDHLEAAGAVKYFRPEVKRQLQNQRIQMRLARQLIKAKLS